MAPQRILYLLYVGMVPGLHRDPERAVVKLLLIAILVMENACDIRPCLSYYRGDLDKLSWLIDKLCCDISKSSLSSESSVDDP